MQLPIIQAARPILGVFSLETFTVAVAQSVDFTDNGRRLSVVTSPQQWAYAVVFPLLSEIATDPSELIEIHVRVRLLDGKVGIGVLRPDESAFIDESFRGPHPKSTDVVLYVEGGQAIGRLIVRNAEQGELASRIEIEEIRVLASERPEHLLRATTPSRLCTCNVHPAVRADFALLRRHGVSARTRRLLAAPHRRDEPAGGVRSLMRHV